MSQEKVTKQFVERRKNPAYRNGWGDGRFGPRRLFLDNSNLTEWSGHQEDWRTLGGIAKGGGSARCRSTGTLPDTGMRFSFRRYSPECVERLYEKASNTSEPPRHEANHGSVHERLSACT